MKLRLAAACLGLALVGTPGLVAVTGPDAHAAETTGGELPVVAVARSDAGAGQNVVPNGRYEFAVHGVFRYDGGTAAYWSVRSLPAYGSDDLSDPQRFHWRRGNFENSGFGVSEVSLAVQDRGELYTTLVADEGTGECLCTNARELDPKAADQWQTVYATFVELPAEVTSVSMHLDGYGTVVHDVPVTDGLPEPQVEGDTVLAGEGWPQAPDAAAVQQAADHRTGGPVWGLFEPSGAVDGSWSATRSGEEESIDIAADVLFEFDKAEITSKASAALDDVAAKVKEAGVGAATVVGHTDSQSDEAYNQKLSERRAEAVAEELTKRLPGVQLTVEGRGETEPVASNDSEEGRALNRRVSVTFTGGER